MQIPDFKTESQLQSYCYLWAHNNLPEIRKLLCYNLNNSKNKIDGARNKSMGLQKGRSDMVLYWKGTAHMIEMKLPGEGQTKDQKKWESKITSHGFAYHICDSFEQFQQIVNEVMRA